MGGVDVPVVGVLVVGVEVGGCSTTGGLSVGGGWVGLNVARMVVVPIITLSCPFLSHNETRPSFDASKPTQLHAT